MDTDLGPIEIPQWIDLLAVFVAGLAGSLLATRRELDITGILILAIVAGLGGGIIRDTLIQRGTPAALENGSYLITAFCAAALGFFFASQVARVSWAIVAIDAVALGLYTLVGGLKGYAADLPMLSVLLLAVVSAAGGGILRDIMLARTPEALLPGAPYAVLSVVGGIIVVILHETDTSEEWLWWLPVAVVVLLRFVTLRLGWQTPMATDLPARVQHAVPRAAPRIKELKPSKFVRPSRRLWRRKGAEEDRRHDD